MAVARKAPGSRVVRGPDWNYIVRCTFWRMGSVVLGLAAVRCDGCMERVFDNNCIEHAIGAHACSLEALACV
jgi:hypothetical protein